MTDLQNFTKGENLKNEKPRIGYRAFYAVSVFMYSTNEQQSGDREWILWTYSGNDN
jgi:hypothetical protein